MRWSWEKIVINFDQETKHGHGYILCGGFPFRAKKANSNNNFELRTLFKIVCHQLPICSWRAKCFLHSLSSVEISCWKVPLNGTSLLWCLWAVSSYDSTFLASELFFNFCISSPQKKWWFQAFQVLKWYIEFWMWYVDDRDEPRNGCEWQAWLIWSWMTRQGWKIVWLLLLECGWQGWALAWSAD